MSKPSDIFEQLKDTDQYGEIGNWEERWTVERLKQRRGDLGRTAFHRGYHLEAVSDEDLTFKFFHKMLKFDTGTELWDGQEKWQKFMGVDISSSTRPGCAIVTLGIGLDGRRYPLEIKVGAWKSPRFVSEILDSYNTFKHQMIFVENNAVQTMLVDWLEENASYLPVQGFHTGKQKADPLIGLPSLDVEFERGIWGLPMKLVEGHGSECTLGESMDDKTQPCGWCRFIREFSTHPQYLTTDVVMATWFAREAVREYWGSGFESMTEPKVEGDFGLIELEEDGYDYS